MRTPEAIKQDYENALKEFDEAVSKLETNGYSNIPEVSSIIEKARTEVQAAQDSSFWLTIKTDKIIIQTEVLRNENTHQIRSDLTAGLSQALNTYGKSLGQIQVGIPANQESTRAMAA